MKPSHIILHHSLTKDSESVSWGAIKRYHTEELGWRDIGYHFGIEQVGNDVQIFTGRMMTDAGAHCKEMGMNRTSLGICFVGNYDDEDPPLEIWNTGIRLVRTLMEVFNIPKKNIYGHYEFSPHKSCPGVRFDVDKFREETTT
uniref:Putative N-acetylmuramoyl-L-alanine amidase n=1 Tax=viral metagenome TaxID=1070528 RepID=A0A6H1ZL64_9ZZZZ